jgi:transcriptional regulator with XRE-family HTH domain
MPRTHVRINGAAVRVIRERSGLSITALAAQIAEEHALRVHPGTITHIELGQRNASPRLLDAIASTLRCPKLAIIGPATEKSRGDAAQ